MQTLLEFIKDFAKKLGISPVVLIMPFSFIGILDLLVFQFSSSKQLQDFFVITSILTILLYFLVYIITVRVPAFRSWSLSHKNEKKVLLQSFFYTFVCLFFAGSMMIVYTNQKNIQEDQALFHMGENKGLAIASVKSTTLSDSELGQKTLQQILQTGLISPLQSIFEEKYGEREIPDITLLPKTMPQTITASLLNSSPFDYKTWAQNRGYDIVVYGEAQKGQSENIFLDLKFKVFDEPKTLQKKQAFMKLYYTVSNYDSDALLASFDNMVKELGGITLYLDEKYEHATSLFSSVIESLEREFEDFSEIKASTETERKSFEKKRDKIQKNLGVVYFYFGNTLLLSEKNDEAEIAYEKSYKLLESKTLKELSDVDNLLSSLFFIPTTYANTDTPKDSTKNIVLSNLSIAYAQNGKLTQAENLLVELDAQNSEDVAVKQNLGIVYLEQGINEIKKEIDKQKKDSGEMIDDTGKNEMVKNQPLENKKLKKAIEILAQTENDIEKQGGKVDIPEHESLLRNNYHNQGIVKLLQEDFDEAEKYFQKELEILERQQIVQQPSSTESIFLKKQDTKESPIKKINRIREEKKLKKPASKPVPPEAPATAAPGRDGMGEGATAPPPRETDDDAGEILDKDDEKMFDDDRDDLFDEMDHFDASEEPTEDEELRDISEMMEENEEAPEHIQQTQNIQLMIETIEQNRTNETSNIWEDMMIYEEQEQIQIQKQEIMLEQDIEGDKESAHKEQEIHDPEPEQKTPDISIEVFEEPKEQDHSEEKSEETPKSHESSPIEQHVEEKESAPETHKMEYSEPHEDKDFEQQKETSHEEQDTSTIPEWIHSDESQEKESAETETKKETEEPQKTLEGSDMPKETSSDQSVEEKEPSGEPKQEESSDSQSSEEQKTETKEEETKESVQPEESKEPSQEKTSIQQQIQQQIYPSGSSKPSGTRSR